MAFALGCALFQTAALHSAETAPAAAIATIGTVSPETFLHPVAAAGVHVWWRWMDGAITREGITKDLETMKAQGIAQATILNVGLFEGRNFGVPRVPFGSAEWFGMYRWAISEAARLGLTLGVHNCDGWSSSGGPWITPEQSMKQFTWSRVFVAGGRTFDAVLPEPGKVAGFYRDVAVVACRTDRVPGIFAGSGAARRQRPAGVAGCTGGRQPHQWGRHQARRHLRLRATGAPGFFARGDPSAPAVHVEQPRRLHGEFQHRGLVRRKKLSDGVGGDRARTQSHCGARRSAEGGAVCALQRS